MFFLTINDEMYKVVVMLRCVPNICAPVVLVLQRAEGAVYVLVSPDPASISGHQETQCSGF